MDYPSRATLPDGAGPGTALTHEHVDAVRDYVLQDIAFGFPEQGASEVKHPAGELAMAQSEPILVVVNIQSSYFREGRGEDRIAAAADDTAIAQYLHVRLDTEVIDGCGLFPGRHFLFHECLV